MSEEIEVLNIQGNKINTDICRACMSSHADGMEDIFSHSFAELYIEFTKINITQNDSLPQKLCNVCSKTLLSFYKFRLQCETSYNVFVSLLSNERRQSKLTDIKESVKNELSDLYNNADLHSNSDSQEGSIDKSECLKDQNAEVKNKNHKYSCQLCMKTFLYLSTLKRHKINCKKNETFKKKLHCGLCKDKFKRKELLKDHFISHKSQETFSCQLCDYIAVDWADFYCHRYNHQRQIRIKCQDCNRSFFSINSLEFHIRGQHLHKPPGLCKICLKQFLNYKNLTTHKLTHMGIKPYKCKLCGKCFTYNRSLILHMRCHSDNKQYVCQMCGSTFKFRTGLTNHLSRIHGNSDSIPCNHCNKLFKNKESLREHMLRVNSIKEFECSECGKMFRSQKELDVHSKWHSDVKPHICNECGKGYKSKYHLKNHSRQHTGERPYKCDICPNSFMTSSALKKHKMIHNSLKPFSCKICEKGFIEKSNMIRHMKTHKKISF